MTSQKTNLWNMTNKITLQVFTGDVVEHCIYILNIDFNWWVGLKYVVVSLLMIHMIQLKTININYYNKTKQNKVNISWDSLYILECNMNIEVSFMNIFRVFSIQCSISVASKAIVSQLPCRDWWYLQIKPLDVRGLRTLGEAGDMGWPVGEK